MNCFGRRFFSQLSLLWPHEDEALLAHDGLIFRRTSRSVQLTKPSAAVSLPRAAQALSPILGPGYIEGDSLIGWAAFVMALVSIFVISFAATLRCTVLPQSWVLASPGRHPGPSPNTWHRHQRHRERPPQSVGLSLWHFFALQKTLCDSPGRTCRLHQGASCVGNSEI